MQASVGGKVQTADRGLRLPKHRIGDFSLFFVWVLFAVSAASGALDEVQEHDILAAAHRAMVATVLLINAILFLLRGPAIRRKEEFVPKLIAFVGTWTVIPLSFLSLTWRSNWL